MAVTEHTITEWVDTHTDALYAWALHKLEDAELAKDIVQDTFISAYSKIDSFEGKSSAKTWLMAILNNKIADHYRKQARNPVDGGAQYERNFFDRNGSWRNETKPQHWQEDGHLLDDAAFVQVLNGCMEKLPAAWADAMNMKYLGEKKSGEICGTLNISTANYWQIIHRAKLSLRQCLEINWFK